MDGSVELRGTLTARLFRALRLRRSDDAFLCCAHCSEKGWWTSSYLTVTLSHWLRLALAIQRAYHDDVVRQQRHVGRSLEVFRAVGASLAPSILRIPHTACVVLLCHETFHSCIMETVLLALCIPFVPLNPCDPPARLEVLQQRVQCCMIVDDARVAEWISQAGALAGRKEGVSGGAPALPEVEKQSILDNLEAVAGTYSRIRTDSVEMAEEGKRLSDAYTGTCDDDQVAYVMFTSGSTGNPKGVVVSRQNLLAYADMFALHPGGLDVARSCARILSLSTPFFDPSIGDAVTTMLVPHATVFTVPRAKLTGGLLLALLEECAPSLVVSTPALWQTVAVPSDAETNVPAVAVWESMMVCLGGERMSQQLVDQWAPRVRLFNIYGVTEATIYQSLERVLPGADVAVISTGVPPTATSVVCAVATTWREGSAGGSPQSERPFEEGRAAMEVTLAAGGDEDGADPDSTVAARSTDLQRTGEIVLSGPQVALGYLADEGTAAVAGSTAFRFNERRRRREYWTGDIGTLCEGSQGPATLRLSGRADYQVKISGQRVSLEEVEHAILTNLRGVIKECCCCCVEGIPSTEVSGRSCSTESGQRIVIAACVVIADTAAGVWGTGWGAADRARLERVRLRVFGQIMRRVLPAHMLPAFWHVPAGTSYLPQTASGKTNRQEVQRLLQHQVGLACRAASHQWRLMEEEGQDKSTGSDVSSDSGADGSAAALRDLRSLVKRSWEHVLGIPVRGSTHFFHTGGDSLAALKAVRMVYLALHGNSDEGIDQHGGMPSAFQPMVLLRHPHLNSYVSALQAAMVANEPLSSQVPIGSTDSLPGVGTSSKVSLSAEVKLLLDLVSLDDVAMVNLVLSVKGWVDANGAYVPHQHLCVTPLHIAASRGNLIMAKLLVGFGAKHTAVTVDGVTPAHRAAAAGEGMSSGTSSGPAPGNGHLSVLRFLLEECHCPLNCRDARQQSLLHAAARFGSVGAVSYLLFEKRMDLTTRDCWQRTAVHWALINDHAAVLRTMASFVESEVYDGSVKERRRRGAGLARFHRLAQRRTHLVYETLKDVAHRLYGVGRERSADGIQRKHTLSEMLELCAILQDVVEH